MKSEFALAFTEIGERSKLERSVILEALEAALVQAYRKALNASTAQEINATIDVNSGKVLIYAEKEVVDEVQDNRTEATLELARQFDPLAQLGDLVKIDSTPPNFGRIAAQAAKQLVLQKLKEAERDSQYEEYAKREGEIIHGTVQSVSGGTVILQLGRAEAAMPRKEQMLGERYRQGDKLRVLCIGVRKEGRGPQITVSRAHKDMLRRLLELEVPEIYNGTVEIKDISREPGHRSKIAVAAGVPGIDPVGACVGMRGMRIQSIVKELHDEKIDVIEWSADPSVFISKALSPARVGAVYLEDGGLDMRNATVVVPDDQLSLAIGRDGQNARLAAKLTHWKIDIKSLSECTRESIKRIAEDPAYAHLQQILESELKHATATIAKMEERRPIMPEEYAFLNKVVDATERLRLSMQKADRAEREARIAAVRATFPAAAYALTLEEIPELDEVLRATLLAAGFASAGTVLETLALDEDAILKLDGVGPKVISDLHDLLLATAQAIPVVDPEPEPELQLPVAELESMVAPEPVVATASTDVPAAELPTTPALPAAEVPERVVDKDEDPDDDGEGKGMLAKAGAKKKKKDKGARRGRTIIYDEDADTFVTGRAAGLNEEDARLD